MCGRFAILHRSAVLRRTIVGNGLAHSACDGLGRNRCQLVGASIARPFTTVLSIAYGRAGAKYVSAQCKCCTVFFAFILSSCSDHKGEQCSPLRYSFNFRLRFNRRNGQDKFPAQCDAKPVSTAALIPGCRNKRIGEALIRH